MKKSTTSPIFAPRKVVTNENGNILHGLRFDDPEFIKFGEVYLSRINRNSIKGWKKHLSATLNLLVTDGAVRFVALSENKSGNVKKCFEATICEANHGLLIIPPGVWLAFGSQGNKPASIINVSTEAHDPKESISVDFETYASFW